MARKLAREAAIRLLFQIDFQDEVNFASLDEMKDELNLNSNDITYILNVVKGCKEHLEDIDNLIRERSEGWKFERISKIDLSILRLALYEIIYRDDIPNSVSINEAVEIAKNYGTATSSAFVNGVLGSYIRSTSH